MKSQMLLQWRNYRSCFLFVADYVDSVYYNELEIRRKSRTIDYSIKFQEYKFYINNAWLSKKNGNY